MVVNCGYVYVHVWMFFLNLLDSFGNSYKAHQSYVLAASFLQHRDGVACAAAGGKHRVCHDYEPFLDVFRKFAVVFDGLVGRLITIKTDMANFGDRNKGLKTFDHSQSGSENRYDRKLAARYLLRGHLADGGLDFDIFKRKVTSDLVSHQKGDLFKKFTEVF